MIRAFVSAAVTALVVTPLAAQRAAAPTRVQCPVAPVARQPDDVGGPLLGAAVGGAGGAIVGGMAAGTLLRRGRYDEDMGPFVYGLKNGWTIGLPLGAHLGNQRRGSFLLDLGASLLAQQIGGRLAGRDGDMNRVLFALAFEMGAVVSVERLTGRGRAPRDTVTIR